MGRKKKKSVKPWCWYCGRDFEDEKILIQHQRAKHFKCPVCHKKLYTGPGLAIHCMQVHRETIKEIPNALPNRTNPEVEIYGTEGIPEEDAKARAARKGDVDEPETKKAKSDEQPTPQAAFAPSAVPPVAPGFWRPGVPGYPQPNRLPTGMPMPPVPFGVPPMQARFPFPNMPPPNTNMPPPIRAPPVSAANNSAPPSRPLFPSASQVSSSTTISSGPVGADFKPISNSKTFEAKPVLNDSKGSVPPPAETTPITTPKISTTISSVGATSKLVHPEEDISLEERRAAKYKTKIAQAAQPQFPTNSVHAAPPYSYGLPPPAANIMPTSRVPGFPKY
ncbi:BUB3-interacting and GLEBS motif-containing protein ZNF207 [Trichoplax sp. H2]|nr:BUB3-interacting and GLEBS motif-containing protein ZNF207 [Trichoplax sp. H2]|eukprot:RDD36963.1 BUB3-interacting and GLEBS motif-containing protein ZNF207 [Trichoplax sp. H2]